jgi:hypothetical protein
VRAYPHVCCWPTESRSWLRNEPRRFPLRSGSLLSRTNHCCPARPLPHQWSHVVSEEDSLRRDRPKPPLISGSVHVLPGHRFTSTSIYPRRRRLRRWHPWRLARQPPQRPGRTPHACRRPPPSSSSLRGSARPLPPWHLRLAAQVLVRQAVVARHQCRQGDSGGKEHVAQAQMERAPGSTG